MKKSPLPLLAFAWLLSTSLLSACSSPSLTDIFVQNREAVSEETFTKIEKAQAELKQKPESPDAIFGLAHLYLQAVRESADTEYYARVESLVERVEEIDPENPEVPFLRGSVLMGRHHFGEALPYAKQVTASHPDTARYYGSLADAQIELGMYDEAEKTLQQMADLRPDANALTRIAYFREINGDREGAIEAMEDAVNQGATARENLAWDFTEIGRLHAGSDPAAATIAYENALSIVFEYPPALAGKARLLMTQGKTDEALEAAEKAAKALPLPEYYTLLADIAAATGNDSKRDTYLTVVEAGYDGIAKSGTNIDLERAKFLLDHDRDLPHALALAQKSYDERNTIYTADTLAWALYKNDRAAEALPYSERALRTNSDDPMIHFHRALIAKALGDTTRAVTILENLLTHQPHFSFMYGPQAKAVLEEGKQ